MNFINQKKLLSKKYPNQKCITIAYPYVAYNENVLNASCTFLRIWKSWCYYFEWFIFIRYRILCTLWLMKKSLIYQGTLLLMIWMNYRILKIMNIGSINWWRNGECFTDMKYSPFHKYPICCNKVLLPNINRMVNLTLSMAETKIG